MRTRRRIRYLCDHCSKGMFQKPAMEKHERICLHNPTRACWACEFDGEHTPTPMPELIAALETGGMNALRVAAHRCPACIVAAMIQQRKADPGAERLKGLSDEDHTAMREFKYKDEMDTFCRAVRDSRPEEWM